MIKDMARMHGPEIIQSFRERMDERFDRIDQTFDRLEQTFDRIETNMVTKEYLDEAFDRLWAQIEADGEQPTRSLGKKRK